MPLLTKAVVSTCDGFPVVTICFILTWELSVVLLATVPCHMASGGFLEQSGDTQLIELDVRCLNGEGCTFSLCSSTLGRDVVRMVIRKLLPRRGAKPTLQHIASPLILHQTLREQGITGTATLSCTYLLIQLLLAGLFKVRRSIDFVRGTPDLEEIAFAEG